MTDERLPRALRALAMTHTFVIASEAKQSLIVLSRVIASEAKQSLCCGKKRLPQPLRGLAMTDERLPRALRLSLSRHFVSH
jgi:hypothetical protein